MTSKEEERANMFAYIDKTIDMYKGLMTGDFYEDRFCRIAVAVLENLKHYYLPETDYGRE